MDLINSSLKYNATYKKSYIILLLISSFYSASALSISKSFFFSIIEYFGIILFCLMQIKLSINNFTKFFSLTVYCFLIISLFLYYINFKFISINLMLIILLIVNTKNVDVKEILKADIICRIICFLCIIAMNYIHFLPSINVPRYNKIRYALGFSYPSTLAAYFFYLAMSLLLYVDYEYGIKNIKNSIKICYLSLILISGFYVFNILTNSRVDFLALIIVVVGLLINEIKPKPTNINPFYGIVTLISSIFVAVYTSYNYSSGIGNNYYLNQFFSNRLSEQGYVLRNFGVGIIGNQESAYINQISAYMGIHMDSQYVSYLVYTGIIGVLFLCIMYIFVLVKVCDNKNIILYFILISIFVKGIVENNLLSYYSIMPFLYAYLISNSKKDGVQNDKENN